MPVPSAVAGLLKRPPRLGDTIHAAIFERIMALEISPGERISVEAVARHLGVSQTPIREALSRLESEGLVRKTPLVGYSATPRLGAADLAELYDMRLQLEPYAARRCAVLMPQAVIDELDQLCREMAALALLQGLAAHAQFARLDMAFHDQIAASCGNRLIAGALGRLHSHVHLFRLLAEGAPAVAASAEHDGLVGAIRARDADAAEAAMRRHIEQSHARFA